MFENLSEGLDQRFTTPKYRRYAEALWFWAGVAVSLAAYNPKGYGRDKESTEPEDMRGRVVRGYYIER